MNRKEKGNNSCQSNYRCGKDGGIYLTLGIGKTSGQNPSSLCLEMMGTLRTGLGGFVSCLLKQKPQAFTLEKLNSASGDGIPRLSHDCLAVGA